MELEIIQVGIESISEIRKAADVAFRNTYREILSAEQIDYMMEWMYSEESLKKQIFEDKNSFFVARVHGKLVGYAAIRPDNVTCSNDKSVFHLEKIYLLPECQGMGYGKQLLDWVCSYVKTLCSGKYRVELNVNRNNGARNFYEKMGFRKVHEGDFPIGKGFFMNDYIMAKDFE